MEDSLKSSVKRSKPNYWYSILGVALVLFLLGCFGLIVLNGQSLVKSYKEHITIMVELEHELAGHEKTRLQQQLANAPYTKQKSITFLSKEDAAKMHEAEFGEAFSDLGFSNPFYDVINFNTKASYMHKDSLSIIKNALTQNPIVRDVFYQEGLVENIEKNVKKVSYLVLILGILFIFVAVTLIHNTIKLALYSNRFLIKNMELVGASWGFISRPFLIKSMQNGFWSVLIALLLLTGTIFFIRQNMVELESLLDPYLIMILYGSISVLGMLITTLSTYYIVNKYLRMRLDDLY
jgi:cell division transport system permease protein